MTADVSVVDQTATNALYVPSAAVTTTGTISTVELLQNGKTTVTRGHHRASSATPTRRSSAG